MYMRKGTKKQYVNIILAWETTHEYAKTGFAGVF